MSLSKHVRTKEDKKEEIDDEDLSMPQLRRETTSDYHISEPELEISFDNILFISDRPMNKDIQEKLNDFNGIRSFDKSLFLNRTTKQLMESDVKHIWCNVSSSHCREWLSKTLPNNKSYDVVCVYKGLKTQKWLVDIKSVCQRAIIVKFKRLQNLKTLNLGEDLRSGFIDIHRPISCIEELLGCTGMLTDKKKQA